MSCAVNSKTYLVAFEARRRFGVFLVYEVSIGAVVIRMWFWGILKLCRSGNSGTETEMASGFLALRTSVGCCQ